MKLFSRSLVGFIAALLSSLGQLLGSDVARAENCPAGQAHFLFQKNSEDLRFLSRSLPRPVEVEWKRPFAPFAGGKGPRRLLNLLSNGEFRVFTPIGEAPSEDLKLPSVPACDQVICNLYPYDIDRDGGTDIVIQEEKQGRLYLIFSRSPEKLYDLGFFQGRLMGITVDKSGRGAKLVSLGDTTLYENLLTIEGKIEREQSYLNKFSPFTLIAFDRGPGLSPALLARIPFSSVPTVLLMPLEKDETSAVSVGDVQPYALPWGAQVRTLDANGDGFNDFLMGATPSRNFWLGVASPFGYFESPIVGLPEPSADLKVLSTGDFSGDGFDDVIFFDQSKQDMILSVSENGEPLSAGGELCASENAYPEHSELSVLGTSYSIVSRKRETGGEIRLLLRKLGNSGERFSLDTVPRGPFLCNGYHPDPPIFIPEVGVSKWGRRETVCPREYGFYFSQEVVFEPTESVDIEISCCPLPNEDILGEHQVESDAACPKNFIAVGIRSLDRSNATAKKMWICQEIGPRYQLGEERGGIYLGRGFSFRGHKERIRLDQIPAAIRTAATRQTFNWWDSDGCVGSPPGSLLVGRQDEGKGCQRMRFRELQYSGFPGDPPKGTAVRMFPNCKGITDPYRPDARCVF